MEKGGAVANDMKDGSACTAGESGHEESFLRGTALLKASLHEKRHSEPSKDEMMASSSSDAQKRETVDDIEISNFNRASDIVVTKDGPPNPASSSVMSKYVEEEPKRYHSKDTNSVETSVRPEQNFVKEKADVPGLSGSVDKTKQMVRSCPENSVSNQLDDRPHTCSADKADATEPLTESGLQKNNHPEYEHPGLESSGWNNARVDVSKRNCNIEDIGSQDRCKSTSDFRISAHGGTNFFLDSSGKEFRYNETCSLSVEDLGTDEDKEDISNEDDGSLGIDSDFYKRLRDSRSPVLTDKRTNIELDDGMVDPLEVALQVAIEVEREVICGSEPSCSFSNKISEGNKQPDSPESIDGGQRQPNNECTTRENLSSSDPSSKASSDGNKTIATSGNLDVESTKSLQKETSYITEATQEPEGLTDKVICDFDLNQDFCTEEADRTINPISSLVSVSVSRVAAIPGLPIAPLQFEGTSGWKRSAAVTSAFRLASPRGIRERAKALSSGGTHCSSKQNNLNIDLNVAESDDDKVSDIKQIPASFGLLSGESSVEASPKRLNLDLNCVPDDSDVRAKWTMESPLSHHGNKHHNLSPLLSSSFLQPLRNVGLNDQPSIVTDLTDHSNFSKSSQNLSASGRLKSDDSLVTIMGMRAEVNQKDIPQASFLANGRIPEPMVDVNLSRPEPLLGMGTSLTYPHSPFHGFNTVAPGPLPFSSTQYGPGGFFPYMVDSRGAPIVPQVMGSGSAIPHTFSRVPFIMAGFPSSNRAGPSQQTLHLNSGSMIDEGCRDTEGLRQFLNPGQRSSMGEHLANSQQSSSSVIGGRRKEPDSDWDSYQSDYKDYQPPWK